MNTHNTHPTESQQFVVDDQVIHALLCLPPDDRADGAELYAALLAGANSTETTRGIAEANILEAIAPVTGRLGHLNDSDRLFVLHAMGRAHQINQTNVERTPVRWGSTCFDKVKHK